ncbi:MAG: Spy/CpxP family protein refolding chaperone [Gemmatimonadota bacterium]|nr:Spy/CpxP family protein refolding chaperone [Gemmatimonadota bacterium]MDE2870564.1 Spy/CpxP family protein refolding chaperone [Gemmatimonadota bacterium]
MITALLTITKPLARTATATFGLLAAMALAVPDLSAQRRGSATRAATPGALTVVERALRHGDRLELTQAQREQLETIRAGMVDQRAEHSARMMRLASEARAGLGEPGAVREALAAMREKAGASRRELRGKYDEIFTDEQKQLLRRLARQATWRQRGARRGGPGWDRGRGIRGRGAVDRGRGGDRFRGRRPPRGQGG